MKSSKPKLYLDYCSYDAAEYAVKHWHYSRTMPTAKLVKIGVWENDVFIGCVIFGGGATPHLLDSYGLTQFEGCELVRVALNKHITPVTRIISIAIKLLVKRCPKLKLIVSFADPSEGHHGGIYQGGNWFYTGTSQDAQFGYVNGKKIHPRTISEWIKRGKIKKRSDIATITVKGKHRYLMPLTPNLKVKASKLCQSFPKRHKH